MIRRRPLPERKVRLKKIKVELNLLDLENVIVDGWTDYNIFTAFAITKAYLIDGHITDRPWRITHLLTGFAIDAGGFYSKKEACTFAVELYALYPGGWENAGKQGDVPKPIQERCTELRRKYR